MIISLELIDAFEQMGVVCLRNFLDHKWLELLEKGFDKNIKNPGPYACYYAAHPRDGLFRDDYCNWQNIEEFCHVIFKSPLAHAAGLLLKAREIRFFHEHIFYKKKGTIAKTPWHQDLPYYCVDGDQGISFWIPLTTIDASNKIEFIARSHTWGKLFRPQKFNNIDSYNVPENLYEKLPDIDNDLSYKKLSWTMERGDILAFDFRTIHGNTNNQNPNLYDRQSIALRFIGENMRYSARPGEKSPPFPEVMLRPGEPLEHPIFPLVWQHT